MPYQRVTSASVIAALSFLAASPAWAANDWRLPTQQANWRIAEADSTSRVTTRSAALKWELGYLALSALDTAQTVDCLERGVCQEANPLFGKHPSTKTLILAKLGGGLAHFALFNYLNDRNPKIAMRAAQVSFALQGTVVALNARISFR
jgi:hypothetical protein